MKTFYTVRDIEDMHAAWVVEIQTHDDVVVTDVAKEKAISLGMRLIPVEDASNLRRESAPPRNTGTSSMSPPSAFSAQPPMNPGSGNADMVAKVKAAVIARLGTDKYNDLLDRIIPQVMSQLKK